MMSAQQYIAQAKAKLGNPGMSDRELGEHLGGMSQTFISQAKRGKMTDPLAMKIAEICGVPPGAVLMVARLEREKDPAVKAALLEWAGKVFGLLPKEGAAALPALAAGPHMPALAAIESASSRQKPKSPDTLRHPGLTGGEGGFRSTRLFRALTGSKVRFNRSFSTPRVSIPC